MPHVTAAAGVSHTSQVVFSGGASGTPLALWQSKSKRNEAQAYLDAGDIELFGMTFEPSAPTTAGYELWFNYSLAKNPNTTIMLGFPWIDYPHEYDAASYVSTLRVEGINAWKDLLADLRSKYPNTTIIDVPYALGVAELRILFNASFLPDITCLQGPKETSLHTDTKGHGGLMLKDLASLIWLNRIYHVDLSTYTGALSYETDLRPIATAVLDAYDAGSVCGCATWCVPCTSNLTFGGGGSGGGGGGGGHCGGGGAGGRLSKAAIAGIGVGVGVLVLALAAGVGVVVMRKRRGAKPARDEFPAAAAATSTSTMNAI